MYLKDVSIEDIIKRTRLDEESVKKIIDKKKIVDAKQISLENEIAEMKNDIKELKEAVQGLAKMMKAVNKSGKV